MAYFESFKRLSAGELRELRKIADREISQRGAIRIPKRPGLFVARKRS